MVGIAHTDLAHLRQCQRIKKNWKPNYLKISKSKVFSYQYAPKLR